MIRPTETRIRTVVLVNPLRAALEHYERSTVDVLRTLGVDVKTYGVSEPSASGQHQLRWLARYLQTVRTAAHQNPDLLISLWPALGYLDFAALRGIRTGRSSLILHDPDPLVSARGYGPFARWIASRNALGASGVVHTPAARNVVSRDSNLDSLSTVLHPTMTPADRRYRRPDKTVVRVLGQYKPDRDLEALHRFAKECPSTWSLEIIGRGWPEVEGWTQDSRFVPEHEFRMLTETSSVVLIPYHRFFQSGVAVRCLEAGVPVVGPGGTSLAELFGSPDHPWLVKDGRWVEAAWHAIDHQDEALIRHRDYHARVLESWSALLALEAQHV